MTVLWENGELPPRKRLCLSTNPSRRSGSSRKVHDSPSSDTVAGYHHRQTAMAMPIEPGLMSMGAGMSSSGQADAVGGAAATTVRCGGHDDLETPITSLSNLGNTCFLNSVLYTLRFAPSFMHNLHHLALDLKDYMSRHSLKCSSLGRGGKSWSSKDLPSLSCGDVTNVKMQIATDKLHQLYEALHTEELKDHMEPFHPHVFLHSLRDVNPIFEGNQQHDAHELLVCLLDNIRETCEQLRQVASTTSSSIRLSSVSTAPPSTLPSPSPRTKQSWSLRKTLNIGRSRATKIVNGSEEKKIATSSSSSIDSGIGSNSSVMQNGDCCTNGVVDYDDDQTSGSTTTTTGGIGHNFISEHFEGVSLLRTTCLECEQVTQRKETFCDICVPITSSDLQLKDETLNVNKLYQNALVTEEYLHDSNKYWCEQCLRYNEAKRCVKFETLPKLLTLQIKRFSSGFGSVVSKVNEHMPTPLTLSCFCEDCQSREESDPLHQYNLYGVIMHLGATIASGHYVAYVKARDSSVDYDACTRDRRKTASLSSAAGGGGRLLPPPPPPQQQQDSSKAKKKWFSRSSPKNGSLASSDPRGGQYFRSSCRGADCCGVRLRVEEVPDPAWLECDDETVRIITKKQLEEILAQKQPKNSALTPYLLFYARQ